MAVVINDNRTMVDEGDATTNFNQGTAQTTNFAEGTGAIGLAVNTSTDQLYWSGTAINFTTAGNELLYIQTANNALQNSWKPATLSDASHAIWVGDGTNDLVLCNAGADRQVFKHSDTQTLFQCMLIDFDYLGTKNTNGEIYEAAGTYASFAENAVTDIGAYFVTNSKALGGGYNCMMDIIRYGTGGIEIIGGTTSDRGTFLEIVESDRGTNDYAHTSAPGGLGIIREYTANTYGCQGTLNFGSSAADDDAWFDDSGVVVAFEDRDVGDDKFKFVVQGNSTDSNNFYLTNSVIQSARPGVEVDMSSSNIDVLYLDTVTFSNTLNAVNFPTDSASQTHTVIGCTFNNCGTIDFGTVDVEDCVISNSNASTNGAVLLDTTGYTANWDGNTFISGGTGHAIYITATGSYTFTNLTFTGYAAQGGTAANRSVYNNSGGAVTITNSGSTGITYRDGASATTTIVDAITVTFTGIVNGTEIRVYETGTSTEKDGIESVTGGAFAASLQGSTGYDVVAIYPGYVPIRLENQSWTASTSVNLNQQEDANQDNPS